MLSDKSAKISIKLFVTTILILTVLLLVHAPVVKADIPDVWYCTYTGTYRVCTELDDYSPESTVFVKGNGFAADTNLQIRVTRPDGSIVNGDGSFTEWVPESNTVTTDEIGEFHYDYVLDGILGMYRVDVLDAEGNVIATHFFTDGQPARVAFSTDAPCSVTVTGGYTNPGDKTGKTFNSATSFSINTEPVTLVTFTYQASVVCSGTTYDFDSASPISPLTSGGSGSSTPVSGHYALSCISTGVSETICNGVDDDCDGSTDEDYTPHSTSCGVGACASTGTTSCVSGTEHNSCTPGTAGTETCNNIDDDCDGTVDESLTRAASNIQGECALNTQTCSAGNWADTASNYIPIAETCDGLDNNCDGTADNGLTAPSANNQNGVCLGSVKVCDGTNGWIEPNYNLIADYENPEATCDRKDNDCDNSVDEMDSAAPTTTSDAPAGWVNHNVDVILSATDSGVCGVQATYYCIDDTSNDCSPNILYTAPVSITAEGTQYVRFLSVDNSGFSSGYSPLTYGNVEGVKSSAVQIDKSAPSGGSISYTDGYYTALSVPITYTLGTDTLSGIDTASGKIQRASASLASGVCGSFGIFSDLVSEYDGSYTDTSVLTNNCYKYQYLISDNVANTATYMSANIAKVDTTPPELTITGATANGNGLPGDLATGFILDTSNNPSDEYLIQFAAGTIADETLANDYFGLKLISSTVTPADLKAYYAARGVPEPFLTYLNGAADGTNSFVFINGNTIKLVDAARHVILGGVDTDMAVPANYPLETYVVEGKIKDLAGNEQTVTLTLIVTGDRIPPVITVPANFNAEATSASGAAVTYTASALDAGDGVVTPICTPVSGSTFALGENTVTCTATDLHYNTATASFKITVVDTTPPVITVPSDIVLEATGVNTPVTWTAPTSTDLVDGSVAVTCTKNSGDTFTVGETIVNCEATDSHTNKGTASFKVTITDTTPPPAPSLLAPPDGSAFKSVDWTLADWTDVNDVNLVSEPVKYIYESSHSASTNAGGSFVSPVYVSTLLSASQIPTPGTPEGIYYWHVKAVDAIGNAGVWSTMRMAIVDDTPPTIVGSRTPAANANGWNNVDVTAQFVCADALSGIASCTPDTTLSGEGASQHVLGTAVDKAGNIATFDVTGINIDKTTPSIDGAATNLPNSNGWYKSNVVVHYTCTDALSDVDTLTGDQTLSAEAAGQSTMGTCVDKAGNSADKTVSGINIDKTVPTITAARDRAPNANNWYNADVTVTFTCADTLSGVESCSPPETLAEGQAQSSTGTVMDLAGNIASVTESGINIDETAPIIDGAATTSPNVNGWYNYDVIVHYTCTDALSTVDTLTGDQTLSTEAAGQSTTGTCVDKAGNPADKTVSGISIDKTAQVTTLTIGNPKSGSNPTDVSLLTEFSLSATPGLSDIDYLEYNFDGGAWTTYSAVFKAPSLGSHALNFRSMDNAGNLEEYQTENIVVGATTLKLLKVAVPSGTPNQYSDPAAVSAILTDVASGNPISGKTITFTIGTQTATATTGTDGVASTTITLTQHSGSTTVSGSFAGDTGNTGSSDSKVFTINKENVAIEYKGDTFKVTGGLSSIDVTLKAELTQEADGYAGDITKAKVTFILTPEGGGSTITVSDIAVAEVGGIGVASTTYSVPTGVYIIEVRISDGNGYWIANPEGTGALVVTYSTSSSVTGGGWIVDELSRNDKGNFGFELKYSKNLAPKGNFVYVWRGEDGFDYRVKSTSWQKGNLGLAFTSATTATFSGNCVVQKIDPATGYGVESWGNSKLTVKIEDNDMKLPQSTGTDRIQITVDASGDGPDRTIAMTGISGGNIVIHSK